MPRLANVDQVYQELVGTLHARLAVRDWYNTTNAVIGDEFFGRKRTIAGLTGDLRMGYVSGVFGLRKMGKTSVVREIGRRLGIGRQDQKFVFYDLETLPQDLDLAIERLCFDLAQRFQQQLKISGLRTRELASIVQKAESGTAPTPGDLQSALNMALADPRTGEARFALALDEIESLVRSDRDSGYVPAVAEFLGALRSLVQEHSNFNVILAGLTTDPLQQEMLYGRENPLFSWAKTTYLGTLSRVDADEMTRSLGARMGLDWDEQACARCFAETSGHPLLSGAFR